MGTKSPVTGPIYTQLRSLFEPAALAAGITAASIISELFNRLLLEESSNESEGTSGMVVGALFSWSEANPKKGSFATYSQPKT